MHKREIGSRKNHQCLGISVQLLKLKCSLPGFSNIQPLWGSSGDHLQSPFPSSEHHLVFLGHKMLSLAVQGVFRVFSSPDEMGKSVRPTGQQTSEEQLLRTSEVPGTLKLIKNRNNLIKVTFLLRKKESSLNTQYFVTVKVLPVLVIHRPWENKYFKLSQAIPFQDYHFQGD